MKSSIPFLTLALASIAFSQGTSSSPASATPAQTPTPSSPAATTSQLKARGPEAIAQQDPNRVIATIDGKQITAKQAADLLKPLAPEVRKRYENQLPQLVQEAYMQEQLAEEAAKLNLDQQSPWKEQIQMARANILTQAYLSKMTGAGGGTVSTADAQQYYNAHPEDFDQMKLSGIFIAFSGPGTPASSPSAARTEEQAREKATDVEKKLKAGSDFATVARTDSDNQQTAAQGGALGTYSTNDTRLPPDVKAAITKLQPGQVTEPIRIPNAMLILKLESHNKLTFEQAQPTINQKIQTDKSQAVMKQEMAKYKIQVQDPEFFNGAGTTNIPSLQKPGPAQTTPPAKPQSQP